MALGIRKKAGVIGLGTIGSRAAANLRKNGYKTYVWSRSPRPEPNFLASAAEVADAVRCIQLYVSDEQAVRACIDSMLPNLGSSHIVVNHATISPSFSCEMARLVESKGASYLEAPFTGSRAAAETASLVYYTGGEERILEKVRPQLQATSKAILHMGAIGDAATVKLATNMISAVTVQVLAESLAFATGAGVAPEKFAEAVRLNGCFSPVIGLKIENMIEGNYGPHFALKHMLKDMRYALHIANVSDLDLPATSVAAATLLASHHEGRDELDFSAIAMHYGFEKKPPLPDQPAPQIAGSGADTVETPSDISESSDSDEPPDTAVPTTPEEPSEPAHTDSPDDGLAVAAFALEEEDEEK